QLEADVRLLDDIRRDVFAADETVSSLRLETDQLDAAMKDARAALDAVRAVVSELDIARATAEADLSHLSHTCEDAVNATLDQVLVEVEQLEAQGQAMPEASAIESLDAETQEVEEGAAAGTSADVWAPEATESAKRTLSAEEAIATLRRKIDRLGPVNMMAIDQFDELESRHVFLTAQRKDLTDSIQSTSDTIKKIDETSKVRF